MALPSRLIQHNSNDTTTPSSSSRSIRHYNNNSTTPSRFNIGTFNVRGLSSATKRNQLSEDLGRLHIDICCLQETKCPGGFDEHPGNYRLIGLQSQSRCHELSLPLNRVCTGQSSDSGRARDQWQCAAVTPQVNLSFSFVSCISKHLIECIAIESS